MDPLCLPRPFPLPAPHPGCFRHSGLSRKRLHRLAMQRVLHVWTYCLNFLYLGRHPTLSELGRRPNAWHQRCFQRLRSLLSVRGDSDQPFPVVPGRSGPELGAALFQLALSAMRSNRKTMLLTNLCHFQMTLTCCQHQSILSFPIIEAWIRQD